MSRKIYKSCKKINLWSNKVRASSIENSKYAIANKYVMTKDELNLLATKSLWYVTFIAAEDKRFLWHTVH